MSKIKLIIEIEEEDYKALSELSEREKANELSYYEKIITQGKPLPEGHGDLIDRDALITELETDYHNSLSESGAHLFVEITNYIDEAKTIVEADKENGNG